MNSLINYEYMVEIYNFVRDLNHEFFYFELVYTISFSSKKQQLSYIDILYRNIIIQILL